MSTLNTQVGGDHYRRFTIQPVEYIIANGIGYLPGNIIKYATRYAHKGGAEDIRKIIQYCELILEFEYGVNSQTPKAPESSKALPDIFKATCRECGKEWNSFAPMDKYFICSNCDGKKDSK